MCHEKAPLSLFFLSFLSMTEENKPPVKSVYQRILLKLSGEALRSDRHLEIDPDVVPIDGFAFDMPSKSVGQDKNAIFILRMDTSVVPTGTVVKLRSTNPSIRFQNKDDQVVVPKKKNATS